MFSSSVRPPQIACTLSFPSPHHCIPLSGPPHRKLVREADSGEEQWIQRRQRRPDLCQVRILLITIPKTKIKQDGFTGPSWLQSVLKLKPSVYEPAGRLGARNCVVQLAAPSSALAATSEVDACGPAGNCGREIVSSVHRQRGCEKDKEKHTVCPRCALISERRDSTD